MNDYYVLLLLKHALFTKLMENHRKPHMFASLGLSWAALGSLLGALGPLLGRSACACACAFFALCVHVRVLFHSWGALGALLAALGAILGRHEKIIQKSTLGGCKIEPISPREGQKRLRAPQERSKNVPRVSHERPKSSPRAAKSAPRVRKERQRALQEPPI